jgi:drug/metabolite transporter (DMT)-like permease
MLGILISIAGVLLVMMDNGLHFNASPLGVGLMFVAVAAAIGYSIVIKKVTGKCSAIQVVAYQNMFGVLYFLPFFLIFDLNKTLQTPFQCGMIWPLINLAVFASSVAFVLYIKGIDKIGVNKANVLVNLIPAFTAIFSFFILDEKFGFIRLLGVAIVIAGVFVSQLRLPKKQSPEEVSAHF